MWLRWLTGLTLSVIAFAFAWVGSYWWLFFVQFFLVVAAYEWANLGEIAVLDSVVVLVSASLLILNGKLLALPILLIIPALRMYYEQDPEHGFDVIWSAAGVLWLSIPANLIYFIRISNVPTVDFYSVPVDGGLILLLVLTVGTVFQDSLALYFGMWFGSKSFAPGLSPNKTWAGLFGGIIGITFIVSSTVFFFEWAWYLAVLTGIILGLVGQLGDLSISALKRRINMDDTGGVFPGHGGILDRVDGLVFNVVVFYSICKVVMGGFV